MIHFENSAAIDRAPGARSKSDEFSKCIILVIERILTLCLKPPNPVLHLLEPGVDRHEVRRAVGASS